MYNYIVFNINSCSWFYQLEFAVGKFSISVQKKNAKIS